MASFLDTITPEMLYADPYPIYQRLRRDHPVAEIPALGCWLVTRWQDVRQVMSHSQTFTTGFPSAMSEIFGSDNILSSSGDLHRGLRASVEEVFEPERAGLAREYARKLVIERVSGMHGQADLMGEVLQPVAAEVFRWMLSLKADSTTLLRLARALWLGALDPGDPAKLAVSAAAMNELDAALTPWLEGLGPDPSSAIARWRHITPGSACPRGVAEILPTIRVILPSLPEPGWAAGNLLVALFNDPDQRGLVRDHPELLGDAVHEVLRWMPPFGLADRMTTRPVELGGARLPAGAHVRAAIGSANRDETVFERPDTFDLRRRRQPLVTFGYGEHACLVRAFIPAIVEGLVAGILDVHPAVRADRSKQSRVAGWDARYTARLCVDGLGDSATEYTPGHRRTVSAQLTPSTRKGPGHDPALRLMRSGGQDRGAGRTHGQ
ncbi:Cytochrome P450-pinF2, plant-inducible [Streptomyces sp. ADI95-16]|uniref:cytochrome P450 n=1 Tax=Streptomyces sp. ADI95-16 TaxID=1522758 RepID=UPI000F42E9D1|nr:cytochrome P450 [Streptomyces sp. ADI95-16]AYV25473.1 Cytochrome P450-pinF2, plant-inducible [Streptomyces sp. ADI95-16]